MRLVLSLSLLAACTPDPGGAELDGFVVDVDDAGRIGIEGPEGPVVEGLVVSAGTGSAAITTRFGAFLFEDETEDLTAATRADPWTATADGVETTLHDEDGPVATLALRRSEAGLTMEVSRADGAEGEPRLRLAADCDADETFLGAGSHAFDVVHTGEAFPLWVSEPGVGKDPDSDVPGDAWFITGTRHASSYPVPWLLRAQRHAGLHLDTPARVEVDLCAADPGRFHATTWAESLDVHWISADDDLDAVRALTTVSGRIDLPPRWAFGPWNDAIKGADRVREVAATLREAGAPATVLWTEDWKGGEQTEFGYRLSEEWTVDRELYPDVEDLAEELEASGFQWFGYFAPFVGVEADSGREASAAGVVIQTPEGEDYTFPAASFRPISMVDLSTQAGRDWAAARMQAAVDLGFDGWMADFAEWLPHDAVMADGSRGLDVHNAYPRAWQETVEQVLGEADATYFCRSGWARTSGVCPIVWLGDQRTSFDTDDGFPTVVPLALGLGASGVPIVTHDVAGYNDQGVTRNPPSDQQLWFRWAALGAFSPVLRVHHGANAVENHQFDTNEETLAFWTRMSTEHMRTWPYRYALAAAASRQGTPAIRPIGFDVPSADLARTDAWMLGPALLVAPVMARDATSREVDLPDAVRWFDWWTGEAATSGAFASGLDVDDPRPIPVFAREGTVVPLFDVIPDTLVDAATDPDLVGFAEADAAREVRVYGSGGRFTEADGTAYTVTGTPSGPGEATATLTAGTVDVAGLTVEIAGPIERTYRVVVSW